MENGSVCWFDIPVTDLEKAKGFYGELLAWKFVPMDDKYAMIQVGENMIGGLRKAEGPRIEVDSPVVYLVVEQLDSAVQKAKDLGADLVGEKVLISDEDGVYHWFRDADKNLMALWAKN